MPALYGAKIRRYAADRMRPDADQLNHDAAEPRLLTVREAAAVLGITVEAVRARIKRGSLDHRKGEDGTVWVRLDGDRTRPDGDRTNDRTDDRTLIAARLDDEVRFLRRELERRDDELREMRRLMAGLVERIPPQLEALQEPREAYETPAAEPEGAKPRPNTWGAQEGAQRSWWRRWFGFE